MILFYVGTVTDDCENDFNFFVFAGVNFLADWLFVLRGFLFQAHSSRDDLCSRFA